MTHITASQLAKSFAQLQNHPAVKRALDFLAAAEPTLMAQQVAINEIPAPTFQESDRANYFLTQFQQLNLTSVAQDEVGNVIGCWPHTAADNVKIGNRSVGDIGVVSDRVEGAEVSDDGVVSGGVRDAEVEETGVEGAEVVGDRVVDIEVERVRIEATKVESWRKDFLTEAPKRLKNKIWSDGSVSNDARTIGNSGVAKVVGMVGNANNIDNAEVIVGDFKTKAKASVGGDFNRWNNDDAEILSKGQKHQASVLWKEPDNSATESEAKALEYICLSAHLDTVFPLETDCRVRKEAGRYYGPGISDNASGLVGMLAIARAMVAAGLRLKRPLLFVATVGEEGNGDLCGARYLFTQGHYQQQIKYFISLDGPGAEHIIHRALGSRRYRITFTGPGGHSWSDFGTVNPAHAIGRLIAKLCAYKLPAVPTSYNVGILEAKGSINTIPQTATCQVDLRSVSKEALQQLEKYFLQAVNDAATAEKHFSHTHFPPSPHASLQVTIDQLGSRPSGELATDSTLVQYALASSHLLGITPRLECASTDANIPISLGLEAITVGAGGDFAGCHTLNEWYHPSGRITALQRTLLLICALGELA
jgi:tripeptide aminopeptidase